MLYEDVYFVGIVSVFDKRNHLPDLASIYVSHLSGPIGVHLPRASVNVEAGYSVLLSLSLSGQEADRLRQENEHNSEVPPRGLHEEQGQLNYVFDQVRATKYKGLQVLTATFHNAVMF